MQLNAEPELKQNSDLTGVALSTQADYGIITVPVQLNQLAAKNDYVTALQELRRETYQNNVPFDNSTLVIKAAEAGFTSEDAYVHGFVWDQNMERIALQRTIETLIHGKFQHARVDASGIFSATYNSQAGNSEIIALGTDMRSSVIDNWGHKELQSLIDSNGVANNQNGHLHSLLNPSLKYHGAAYIPHQAAQFGKIAHADF